MKYSVPEIEKLWSKQHELETWHRIEMTYVGTLVKSPHLDRIHCPSLRDVQMIEDATGHDLYAYLHCVEAWLPPEVRPFLHYGLTSSDLKDTALVLTCRASMQVLVKRVQLLVQVMEKLQENDTEVLARTHGQGAALTTWRLRVLGWITELEQRLVELRNVSHLYLGRGKLCGPTGRRITSLRTVESEVLGKFNLDFDAFPTQILSRDRFAQVFFHLALLGSTLERIALNIRLLCREGEVYEPGNLVGSSAMPHKKNPIRSERICGLSRKLRSLVPPALENIPLWEERDLTHSSAERLMFPEAFNLSVYCVSLLTEVLQGLHIDWNRVQQNIEAMGGLEKSHSFLMKLQDEGSSYTKAHADLREAMEATRLGEDP